MQSPAPLTSHGLLPALYAEIFEADFVWQIIAFACAVALSIGCHFVLKKQPLIANFKILPILLFPILLVLFLACGIVALQQWELRFGFLELCTALVSALILVKALVMMVRAAFPHNRFLNASEKIISVTIWLWMALYITDVAPYLAERLDAISFTLGDVKFTLWRVLNGAVLIFLVILACFCLSAWVEKRVMKLSALDLSLQMVLVRAIKAVFVVLGVLASLSFLGINMTALSVFTGALGVGLGFGFQKIASNYVSGFIILFERSIQIGNLVSISGVTGKVTQITTRFTVLKTAAGEEVLVPNEMLVSNVVQNKTFSDTLTNVSLDVGVSYGSDVDLAGDLMLKAAAAQPRVLKTPAPSVLLSSFGDSAINLKLSFWIADPEIGTVVLISNINRAIWKAFNETNGVEMPFPQREVRILK